MTTELGLTTRESLLNGVRICCKLRQIHRDIIRKGMFAQYTLSKESLQMYTAKAKLLIERLRKGDYRV